MYSNIVKYLYKDKYKIYAYDTFILMIILITVQVFIILFIVLYNIYLCNLCVYFFFFFCHFVSPGLHLFDQKYCNIWKMTF